MSMNLAQSHLTNVLNTMTAIANGSEYEVDGKSGPFVGCTPADLLTLAVQGRITIKPAAAAAMIPEPSCPCSLRARLVGDGCSICNPEYWNEMLQQYPEGQDDFQANPSPNAPGLDSSPPLPNSAVSTPFDA